MFKLRLCSALLAPKTRKTTQHFLGKNTVRLKVKHRKE